MMVIPILTWETAQAAPHTDRAWNNRPKQETESMYLFDRDGRLLYRDGMPIINRRNYCMRIEYDTFRMSTMQNGLGHPMDEDIKRQWTENMIRKYDPNMWSFIQAMRMVRQGERK